MRPGAFEKLEAIKISKKKQIQALFLSQKNIISTIKDSQFVRQALRDYSKLSPEDTMTDSAPRSEQDRNYNGDFRRLADNFGFMDILLILENGEVVYSLLKASDLGQNLLTGRLKDSKLARAFLKTTEGEIVLADFEPYPPASNEPAGFMVGPVHNEKGDRIGALAARLSMDRINSVMLDRAAMGPSGQAYLVGPDKLMRSDSFFDPEYHSVLNSFAKPSLGRVNNEASSKALAGDSGRTVLLGQYEIAVLTVYGPLDILGQRWAVMVECDEDEVMSRARNLDRLFLIIGLTCGLFIIILATVLARKATDVSKCGVLGNVVLEQELLDVRSKIDALISKLTD